MELESPEQAKILRYLHSLQSTYAVKIVVANRAGTLDIVLCFKGRFIAIEAKSDTGTPSPLQKKNMSDIIKAGGIAIVARDVETVKELMRGLGAKEKEATKQQRRIEFELM